jgi:hypothetical protein
MGTLTVSLEAAGPYALDAMPVADARARWMAVRARYGFSSYGRLTSASNLKLELAPIRTVGLTLAPSTSAGLGFTTCGRETAGCKSVCVLTHGRGAMRNVRAARNARTDFLATDPSAFVVLLASELQREARNHGDVLVRLNVASDIRWERIAPALFELAGCRFYDYTKWTADERSAMPNYRRTYSVSERPGSESEALATLDQGGTAAVVLDVPKGALLPTVWLGRPLVDGDASDDRTADPAGSFVGLRAKGAARNGRDTTGFVKSADR